MVLKRGRYATFSSLVRNNLLNVSGNPKGLLIIFLVLGMFFVSGCKTYTTSVEVNKTKIDQVKFNECTKKYTNYFSENASKTFQIVFSSFYSKEQIEKFLSEEVKTNFEYRMEFKGRYNYFIHPMDNGLQVLCTIEQSPYYLGTSLIGGPGGTFTNEVKENIDLSHSLSIFYNPKFLPLNIVIGSKSKDLDAMMKFISYSKIFADSKFDSDITNISIENSIFIGGPCANKLVANLYESNYDCSKVMGLKDGQGLVKIIKKQNSFIYIIAGQTQNDTLVTAQIVSRQELNLTGTEVIIDTVSKTVAKKDDNKLNLNITITELNEKNKTWICWTGKQCEFVKPWGDSPATIIPYFKAVKIPIYGIKKEKPGSPTALCGASAGDTCILVDNTSLDKLNLSNIYTK